MKVTEKIKSSILKASTVPVLAFCAFTPSFAQGVYALRQVNTPYDEQQPVISSKEELFLSVAYHPDNTGGGKDLGDVWYSKKNDFNQWQEARPVKSLSTSGYDLLIGFPDDQTALVYHDGKKKAHGIHQYKRVGETEWEYMFQLDFGSFRNNGRSFSARLHPSGEILVMSMNSYGSYGNEDIYVSFKQSNGKWSVPKNIGPVINSYEQEMTPFLSDDKQILYFSTNGHGTEEGRDIFYAQRLDNTWENWTKPKRLKDDINTRGVELSYFIDPNSPYTAFVTTTKDSEGYGDIMMQRKEEIVLEEVNMENANPNRFLAANFPVRTSNQRAVEQSIAPIIEQSETSANTPINQPSTTVALEETVQPENEVIQKESISEITAGEKEVEKLEKVEAETSKIEEAPIDKGNSITLNAADNNTLKNIPFKVVFKDQDGKSIGVENDHQGPVELTLRKGTSKLTVSSPNYLPVSLSIEELEQRAETILLTPAKSGVKMVLEEVLFKKGTSEIANENSMRYIDELVEFLKENPDLKIRLEGHTDNVGNASLNKELSMDRAGAIRDYMVNQGVEFERIRLRGLGGSQPISSNDTEEGREQNRRVEMVIIQ
ncbi:OmpA family protein [Echinicola sp. CAU 1574]|uniref:OmpA family protein n=1 Tax=Echinicola arenosa TaxID=2774144 RepID=A0ABR9AQ60_9BACT|nr:OmpA family protein [Echinicola arenosa]MBD8490719.1 OmpA family protein [Echinicola arenosa]